MHLLGLIWKFSLKAKLQIALMNIETILRLSMWLDFQLHYVYSLMCMLTSWFFWIFFLKICNFYHFLISPFSEIHWKFSLIWGFLCFFNSFDFISFYLIEYISVATEHLFLEYLDEILTFFLISKIGYLWTSHLNVEQGYHWCQRESKECQRSSTGLENP